MADLAEEIAERAIDLAGLPPVPAPERLGLLADLTTVLVRQGLEAFVKLDADRARRARRLDPEVGRCNGEIVRELIAMMRESPARAQQGLLTALGERARCLAPRFEDASSVMPGTTSP